MRAKLPLCLKCQASTHALKQPKTKPEIEPKCSVWPVDCVRPVPEKVGVKGERSRALITIWIWARVRREKGTVLHGILDGVPAAKKRKQHRLKSPTDLKDVQAWPLLERYNYFLQTGQVSMESKTDIKQLGVPLGAIGVKGGPIAPTAEIYKGFTWTDLVELNSKSGAECRAVMQTDLARYMNP